MLYITKKLVIVALASLVIAGCAKTEARDALDQRFYINAKHDEARHINVVTQCYKRAQRAKASDGDSTKVAATFALAGLAGLAVNRDLNEERDANNIASCMEQQGYVSIVLPPNLSTLPKRFQSHVTRKQAVRLFHRSLSIEERAAWIIAAQANTTGSYRDFLKIFPNGVFADEAVARLSR